MDWWAETDRVRCRDDNGNPVEVIVRQHVHGRDEGLTFGPPSYATSWGERLVKIDGGFYRLENGTMLTRIRGR